MHWTSSLGLEDRGFIFWDLRPRLNPVSEVFMACGSGWMFGASEAYSR